MSRDADVVQRVRTVAERVAGSFGLEIFDIQFRREPSGLVLRVQVDRPGPSATADQSVSVEQCAHVSRDVSAILDVEDIVPGAYVLEVSSPGLDRPLRGEDDYRRFVGRRAKIVVRERVDGQSFLKGRLEGVNGGHVVVLGDDGRHYQVPFESIRRSNLEVEF